MTRTRSRDRGAAAVELALVLPLLLLVVAGIVDYGRAFYTQIALTNAAREGARAASVSTLTLGQIQARTAAAAPGMTLTTTASLCPGTGNASVTASTSFEWILLGPVTSMFGASGALPDTLSSTAVMRCSK